MNWSGYIKYIHIPNQAANIKTLIVDSLLAGFLQTEQLLLNPLPDDVSGDEKELILQNRNAILNAVEEYIDTYLDTRKVNILDPLKPDYVKSKE